MKPNKPGYMTTPKERQSYWTYFVGQNIYYAITAAFISTYLAMQGIDLTKVAAVLLVVKIWDAINDPLFGFLFDRIQFKNGQKSMPWLRFSTALMPFVTIAIFSIPGALSETGKLVWFGVSYVLWDTVYTLTDAPAYAMLNTMTDNIQERTELLSINRIYSGIGQGIYGVLLTVLISEKVGLSATWTIVLLSVLSTAFMTPLCFNCKERNYHPGDQEERFTFRQMWHYLKNNKYLLTYYGGYCAMDALKTSTALGLFASFYLFGSATFNMLLGFLAAGPGFVAAFLAPKIVKKFDKMKVLMLCNLLNVLFGFAIFFCGWENKTLFIILNILRAAPASIQGVLAFMFTPDCAEYGQYKSGVSAAGITFAIQTFSVKITAAVSSSLALFLLGLFNWVSVQASDFAELEALGIQQSAQAINGLWIVYALIPTIGLAIAGIFYLFYKLNDKDVQIMAKCNSGEITREEAEKLLSRKY
ncbi:MAG: MFS transporter [Oscillospiraceae bacterium]|nr:MFS transporter [Oscillospiraceae bacterium]